MLRPKLVIRQRHVAAVLAPLAFALSMSISHQAMATCALSGGGDTSSVWTCTGEDNIFSTDVDHDFGDANGKANTGATFDTDGNTATGATGNKIIRAKGDAQGAVEITNNAKLRARIGVVDTDINGNAIAPTGNAVDNDSKNLAIYGVKGIDADGVEEFTFTNNGSIDVIHKGLGQAAGVFLQNDAELFTMVNNGKIFVTRGELVSYSVAANGAITATAAAGGTSGTLRVIAGIYNNEEEIRDHNVVNSAGAEIIAHGPFSAGIFTRSNSFELVNYGTIAAYETQASAVTQVSGTSAALVMWDGRLLKQMPDPETSACASQTGGACSGREAGFGKSFVENNGKILGNVIVTGLNGQTVMAKLGASADPISITGANGAIPNANVAGGMVDRRDSEIVNNDTIVGNFYYGNGAHVLNNTGEGKIDGDIIVDMRRVTNYLDANNYNSSGSANNSAPYNVYVAGRTTAFGDDEDEEEGGAPTIYTSDPTKSYADALADAAAKLVEDNPDRHFTFENAGKYEGDISVLTINGTYDITANSSVVPQVTITPQTVDIKPHITGNGSQDEDDPSKNIGYIDGTLQIGKGTMAGWAVTMDANSATGSTISDDGAGGSAKTTVTPITDWIVKDGDSYLVAEKLYGTKLPGVTDTFLVDWTAYQVGGPLDQHALAIKASVADASTVGGLSAPGIATLNGLLDGSTDATVNALGGAILMMDDDDDIRKAGEQLAPETNFATQQAAWTLNFLTGSYIDNRLAGVGATAGNGNGGGFGAPSGLGMQQSASASQAPAGRMSLGLGTNDGRMNIGANDGRMDAGIYDDQPDTPRYSSAMWGQAFGAGLDQGERANVDGYQTHIYGAMAGADNWVTANTRIGFAGGYGNTSIDGSGDTQQNKTDIDSYLGILYGAYKGSGWYASGRLGYAWHDYTTARYLTVPVTDTATGGHSGDQYSASGEIGAPLHFMGGALTPIASLTWSQLDQSGYTEASGGGMGLTIASQENTSLSSGLGAKALIPIAIGTLLEGRAIWYHEFEDTNQQVTAAFGGGADFNAAGPGVGRDTAAVGVGLFAYAHTGVSFQLNYDALLRQDFTGHTGSGRLKVEF
jgi:outer membrane autotransporter protein